MTYDAEGRQARKVALSRLTRRQLANIHLAGAGQLMPRTEVLRWTHEEIEAAILDAEFGPLPQTEQGDDLR